MKTIEDYLEKLDGLVSIYPYSSPKGSIHPSRIVTGWDQKFVSDVSTHTIKGSPLSTAQANVAIKILRKYVSLFAKAEQTSLLTLLNAPQYRNELKQTVEIPREVRWIGGSTLLIRSPYNPVVITDLKNIRCTLGDIIPKINHRSIRAWKVVLDDANYKEVMNFIKKHNFAFDDDVLRLFMNIESNIAKPASIRLVGDQIEVEINNDVLSTLWLEEMDWLRDV